MTARHPSRIAAWTMAARPRTLPAAVAPVAVGTAMAAADGVAAPLPALAALLGAVLIQIATNLGNDYFDFRKGGDTEDRIGPTRVVQAGLLSGRAVLTATIGVLAAAVLVGLYLVWVGGVPILVIGVLSLACAVAYTGGPFPLAYHGLGEPFVFVFFGLVAVAGTYWVQALTFEWGTITAGAGVGALATALLVVNNVRDIETDARAGKRTLAVRLGRRGSRYEYLGLAAVAATAIGVGVGWQGWSPWTAAALVALLFLRRPATRLRSAERPEALVPALGETARALTWYAGLLVAGFLVSAAG